MSVGPISSGLKTLPKSEIFTVAAGCFWGVEHIYKKHFADKGIIDCRVGYANGDAEKFNNPTYKQVCTNETDFAEALQVSFDPAKISYKELVAFFFRIHDPTQLNEQGPDKGTQYRSGIFTLNDEQTKIAKEELEAAQKQWYPNHKIVTIIEKLNTFYDAEDYHQAYLFKNADGYHCPTHFLRTTPKA